MRGGSVNPRPKPACSCRYQCPIFSKISNVTQAFRCCNYNSNRPEKLPAPTLSWDQPSANSDLPFLFFSRVYVCAVYASIRLHVYGRSCLLICRLSLGAFLDRSLPYSRSLTWNLEPPNHCPSPTSPFHFCLSQLPSA